MIEEIDSEYETICDEILKIDKKIRFAGVFKSPNVHGKMQEGIESCQRKMREFKESKTGGAGVQ